MAAQKPARASPELRTAPLSPRYLGIYTTPRDTAYRAVSRPLSWRDILAKQALTDMGGKSLSPPFCVQSRPFFKYEANREWRRVLLLASTFFGCPLRYILEIIV